MYDATPLQTLVQGIVTFPGGVGTQPMFTGIGVSSIARDPASGGQGAYILTFDRGLPGLAGAIDAGTPLLLDPFARSLVTMRGSGTPPVTLITNIAVSYLTSPIAGVGADRMEIVLQNVAFLFIDPPAGFEVILWRGF
jgi:hypothetical protein